MVAKYKYILIQKKYLLRGYVISDTVIIFAILFVVISGTEMTHLCMTEGQVRFSMQI